MRPGQTVCHCSFRLSAIDGHGWEIAYSIKLAAALKELEVDVIDCSAGGITGAPAFRAQDDGKPLPKPGQRPLGF